MKDSNQPKKKIRVDNRVTWSGYHIMDYYDAANFTVSEFITGEE
ncbi:hypothetical protein H5410_028429 [Solanum commersonii]|uniref:Uncharacterized protein n=1 Tax=Solanum commersonii TaxID=4109 RepID=A0A9J5Z231_SOLCO|nr:hypothetical protein H5410_028429 [Solanum commersonii]